MRYSYESKPNGTTFLPAEAEDEGLEATALSGEAGSWYEHESPFLSMNREPGNEVAPPDPAGEAARAPWDISSEAEDPALQAWTSDGYAEKEVEGLTFYGEEPAYQAAPDMEREDSAQELSLIHI